MQQFKIKPEATSSQFVAATFDEFVEYGKANGGNIVNGMPWHFIFEGQAVTHENDNCYLILIPSGTVKFNRGEMLVADVKGYFWPCNMELFNATYAPV